MQKLIMSKDEADLKKLCDNFMVLHGGDVAFLAGVDIQYWVDFNGRLVWSIHSGSLNHIMTPDYLINNDDVDIKQMKEYLFDICKVQNISEYKQFSDVFHVEEIESIYTEYGAAWANIVYTDNLTFTINGVLEKPNKEWLHFWFTQYCVTGRLPELNYLDQNANTAFDDDMKEVLHDLWLVNNRLQRFCITDFYKIK